MILKICHWSIITFVEDRMTSASSICMQLSEKPDSSEKQEPLSLWYCSLSSFMDDRRYGLGPPDKGSSNGLCRKGAARSIKSLI